MIGEFVHGRDTMPTTGNVGLVTEQGERSMAVISNRPCRQIGLPPLLADSENPFS